MAPSAAACVASSSGIAAASALVASLAMPFTGITAPLQKRIDKKRAQVGQGQAARGRPHLHHRGLQHAHLRPPGRDPRDQRSGSRRSRATSPASRPSCSRAGPASRWPATAWSGCAASWRPHARCSRQRLVEIYKSDEPDSLTVVLEADGFEDLLERTEYPGPPLRPGRPGHRPRAQAAGQGQAPDRPAGGARGQGGGRPPLAITQRRDSLASSRNRLVAARGELAGARAQRRGALSKVRSTRVSLEKDLDSLEAESERVQARLQRAAAAARSARAADASSCRSTARFTSPFGSRWGRLHAGVDIAAPDRHARSAPPTPAASPSRA